MKRSYASAATSKLTSTNVRRHRLVDSAETHSPSPGSACETIESLRRPRTAPRGRPRFPRLRNVNPTDPRRLVILTEGYFTIHDAKTALGVIRYGHDEIVAILDSAMAGRNLREVMPPGSDTGDAMLAHDGEEGGVLVRGRVEVTVGDEVRVLGPGDAYYFESRQPHRFRNIGDEPAVLVSANTPPTF